MQPPCHRRLTTSLLLLALLPLATGCNRLSRAVHGNDAMEQVLITVDGQPITERDVIVAMQNRYGDDMMENLMMQRKIAHQADKLHVVVDDKVYQEAHEQLAKSVTNPDKLKGEDAFLRSRLLLDAIAVKGVAEQERHQFYNDFKEELQTFDVSHILVPDEHEATQVEQQLKSGTNFAVLAGQMSTDKRSGSDGGHLGPMTYGELKRTFGRKTANAIRHLKPSVVSAPLHSPYGFHIVKVASVSTTYDELKPVIDKQMAMARREGLVQDMQLSLDALTGKSSGTSPAGNVFAPVGKASQPNVFTVPSSTPAAPYKAPPAGHNSNDFSPGDKTGPTSQPFAPPTNAPAATFTAPPGATGTTGFTPPAPSGSPDGGANGNGFDFNQRPGGSPATP